MKVIISLLSYNEFCFWDFVNFNFVDSCVFKEKIKEKIKKEDDEDSLEAEEEEDDDENLTKIKSGEYIVKEQNIEKSQNLRNNNTNNKNK